MTQTTPFLTEQQLAELERRLVSAETEWATTEKHGPKQKAFEFTASEWMRRLLDEVKARRAA